MTRDGLPVISIMTRPVGAESFGAMAAALLGAGEAAMQEWSEGRPDSAQIESAELHLDVIGLDADFLLAVMAPAQSKAGADLDVATARLRGILGAGQAAAAKPLLVR